MKPIKPDNQQRVMVDFIPAPGQVNPIVGQLNRLVTQMSPQEFAIMVSSQIAAIAYVMHASNSTEQVQQVFNQLAADAGRQYEHRKKLVEKEQSAIIRLDK